MNTKTPTSKKPYKQVEYLQAEQEQTFHPNVEEDLVPPPQPKKRRLKLVLRALDTKQEYHEEQLNLAIQLRRGLVEGTECRKLIDLIILRLADQNEMLLAEQRDRARASLD